MRFYTWPPSLAPSADHCFVSWPSFWARDGPDRYPVGSGAAWPCSRIACLPFFPSVLPADPPLAFLGPLYSSRYRDSHLFPHVRSSGSSRSFPPCAELPSPTLYLNISVILLLASSTPTNATLASISVPNSQNAWNSSSSLKSFPPLFTTSPFLAAMYCSFSVPGQKPCSPN